MEKTIECWLEELPKELRDSALKATAYRSRKEKVRSLSMAICCGFTWLGTKEGIEFWDSFSECLDWAECQDKKDMEKQVKLLSGN